MEETDCGVPFPGGVLPPAQWISPRRVDGGRFDWDRIFGRPAPRVLDVGCGNGRFLIGSAAARPDRDHLGIDLIRPLIEQAADRAARRGLRNVAFAAGDAVAWLRERATADSIDEIHVYHPQPYYDPAEAGLGMLTAGFFARAWEVVRKDGLLVLQTDNRRYGRYLQAAVRMHFDPEVIPDAWPDAPSGRTRREIVARLKGLPVLRIAARRRAAPVDVDLPPPYFDPDRPGLRRRRVVRKRP